MFGLLLEEMPGTEVVPWSQKPDDVEKQLIWKEQMAALILFGKAFQACNKSHTSAFVHRFFGISMASSGASSNSNIKNDSKESVTVAPAFMMNQIVKPTEEKKPIQATLSSFMKYDFVVKNIQKIERTKKAAIKKAAKAKDVKEVKKDEKPKNVIILEQ
jgi:hypothetical protein